MKNESNNQLSPPQAVVVGAGITGLRTSLNLADAGYHVWLVDRQPTPGGLLLQIEQQFPTDHCGLCRLLPQVRRDEAEEGCLRQGLIHRNVTFLPQTTITAVKGDPGKLEIELESVPMGVDPDLCIACGECETACPIETPDPFNAGLTKRKAIHRASPFSPGNLRRIDWDACDRCGACAKVCPTNAVTIDDKVQRRRIGPVGLVVLATGRRLYDPSGTDLYGAGHWSNVLTAAAFERLTSPLGPFGGPSFEGLPHRPSDGAEAKRIAWIQCVGSRNVMIGADYCSSACCMFAVKEASLVRERSKGQTETVIFYMDMRTFGRDFQRYKDRAENELGVRFVRCRVHSLDEAEDSNQVLVRYVDPEGRLVGEVFDLVVLSAGQAPADKNQLPNYAEKAGVLVTESSRQWCDIAEALMDADAVSEQALTMLRDLELEPIQDEVQEPSVDETAKITEVPIDRRVLVVGAGPAGLTAALSLAHQDIDVTLIERSDRIGWTKDRLADPSDRLSIEKLAESVTGHPRIEARTGTQVHRVTGPAGKFSVKLKTETGQFTTETYGAAVLATGGIPLETEEYGFGRHERILSVSGLRERLLETDADIEPPSHVVFILCAGSRREPHNYCSRFCCPGSLDAAVRLKERWPSAQVTVFYRDVMTYGESETLYTEARRKGVHFIPFEPAQPPEVTIESTGPVVTAYDPIVHESITLTPDWLTLALGGRPNPNDDLARIFKIPVNPDGFLMEADVKWRPLDSARAGVFLAGFGRAPARLKEAVMQGRAAAGRAMRLLTGQSLETSSNTAFVREELCVGCLLCLPVCPYNARYLDDQGGPVIVDALACQSCGMCVGACPTGAAELPNQDMLGLEKLTMSRRAS